MSVMPLILWSDDRLVSINCPWHTKIANSGSAKMINVHNTIRNTGSSYMYRNIISIKINSVMLRKWCNFIFLKASSKMGLHWFLVKSLLYRVWSNAIAVAKAMANNP